MGVSLSLKLYNCGNCFFRQTVGVPNGRYLSWEHCYKAFCKERKKNNPDYDYLCLQLSFYLASWGMYRGSSFLLKRDYKVHKKVVIELLKKEYDPLVGIECKEYLKEDNLDLLFKLVKKISCIYNEIRKETKCIENKNDISQTLVTKVLLGTLACTPAYDRFFVIGIRENKTASGNFNKDSISELSKFYEKYKKTFEKLRKNTDNYPQMKILDMMFWQYGFNIDEYDLILHSDGYEY